MMFDLVRPPTTIVERTFKTIDNKLCVSFGESMLEHMYSYAQVSEEQVESGGQLFCRNPEVSPVKFCTSTGPYENDIRTRYQFNPDSDGMDNDRNRLFQDGLYACGLWHTHPESAPTPSDTDRDTAFANLHAAEGDLNGFILVTLGNAGTPLNMSVYAALLDGGGTWVELTEGMIDV